MKSLVYHPIHVDGEACQEQAFGNCSQLCEESSSEVYKYTCSCISGYSLQIDGLTCVANGMIVTTFVCMISNLGRMP